MAGVPTHGDTRQAALVRHRLTPTMTASRPLVDRWLRLVELAFDDARALRRIRQEARQAGELCETELDLVVGRVEQYLNHCRRR